MTLINSVLQTELKSFPRKASARACKQSLYSETITF